jgi:excisionase family DNA binding protein
VSRQIHTSVHTACQGALSIDEAARLLRVDASAIEEAVQCGQLPTVQRGERVLIDGPALLTGFCQPALGELTDAS